MTETMLHVSGLHVVLRFVQRASAEWPKWKLTHGIIQKSMYFMPGNRFCFRWSDYGPTSGEVMQILRQLDAAGRIDVRPPTGEGPSTISYVVRPGAPDSPWGADGAMDEVFRRFAGTDTARMRLLASAHMMAEREGVREAESLHRMLRVALPEGPPELKDVEWAMEYLDSAGLLQ